MSNSSESKNLKTSGQSQTADDILASLMADLKDIEVPIEEQEKTGNNVDEYSNFVNVEWQDTVETVIPKFMDYHEHVSEEGQAVDGIRRRGGWPHALDQAGMGSEHDPQSGKDIRRMNKKISKT